ncbi:MAG: hypothetical protein RL768_2251 [Nitrospirota bacterium]|jgi:hypothetical protein
MLSRILIAAFLAWFSATSLALLFAAGTSGDLSIHALLLPGVIPVTVMTSTAVAVFMTPLVYWSLKSNSRNLAFYGWGLLLFLAAYIGWTTPNNAQLSLYGSLAIGVVGVVAIGLVHR